MPHPSFIGPGRGVSVCMATHNGERFLVEQLESILGELGREDEVIIVDDCSTDRTREVVATFTDSRIRLYVNSRNLGAEQTFDRAIGLASKDIIFLSDQDDVWIPGRVALMVRALEETGKMVISSNSEYIDAQGSPVSFPASPVRAEDSAKHVRNIFRAFSGGAPYYGCAMAFRRDIVNLICPIPKYVESHDLWVAIAGNLIRSNVHLEARTLRRRIHGANASVVRRSLPKKLWSRVIHLRSVIHLLGRYFTSFKTGRLVSAPTL